MLDFVALANRAKLLAGLNPEDEALLRQEGAAILPHLGFVTEQFYGALLAVPETQRFLEGHLERLKLTHRQWLERLFTGHYDPDYAAYLYEVGRAHVRANLPSELMACGITQIGRHLYPILIRLYADRPDVLQQMLQAVNAALGFSLMLMLESYQDRLLTKELERFLAITGISRALFNNLANARRSQ